MADDRLGEADFQFLATWLSRRTGLMLTLQRPDFAETRLKPVMRRFGFKTLTALVSELHHNSEALAQAACEAMTVNDSAFFRDPEAFAELRDIVLPELVAQRLSTKTLRIWCAAAAAGQEAYSVAMLLDDMELIAAGWTIEMIATDLNSDVVARARTGLYAQIEIERGLSTRRLADGFRREGDQWRVRKHLRQMVTFRPFNLLDSFGWLWPMDLVLCRNVLMYFDTATRRSVLEKMSDILAPDGTLLIGTGEMIVPSAGFHARNTRSAGFFGKTDWRNRPDRAAV